MSFVLLLHPFHFSLTVFKFNVTTDVRNPVKLAVSGHIPSWVAGSLYRTGPSSYKVPRAQSKDGDFTLDHWFDGFTTVHRFDLIAGENEQCQEAQYSSHSLVDKMIEEARQTGNFSGISFAQRRDPCDSFYKKLKTTFDSTPYANIGVAVRNPQPGEIASIKQSGVDVSGKNLLTVTTDAANVCMIDADTMEPLGITNQKSLHPSLGGPLSAAHAAFDPVNGDVYNYNLGFGPSGPIYRVFRASPGTGKTDVLATISGFDIKGSYIHSLFLTENFVVLCIWTAYFKKGGLSILFEHNLLDAIAPFDKSAKATWLVVDRRHGRGLVKKFTSPAFFCFHTTNAFETPNTETPDAVDITCELYEFQDLDVLHRFYYDRLISNAPKVGSSPLQPSGLSRYQLANVPLAPNSPSSKKPAQAQKILHIPSPLAGDLPRFNPRFATKPHRYIYSFVNRDRSSFADGLVKTDAHTQTAIHWDCDKHTPGEPVFIARPDGQDEDDGVLLCVVLNGETGTSYLLCLDARTMTEVGRVEVGLPVPFGLHGKHVKAKSKK